MKHFSNTVLLFLGIFLTACSGTKQEVKTPPPPNIIYILADDLGYGDLSCLNKESKISTPHIDQLAHSGITFTDAHSGSAVCTPTRYGILTGRYCWRSRLKKAVLSAWEQPLIEEGRLTVGDMLQEQGYNTACIGKWHLGWDWPTVDRSKMSDLVAAGTWENTHEMRQAFADKVDFSAPLENGPINRGFQYYFGDDVPNFPPYCFIENDRTLGIPNLEKPQNMYGRPGPMIEGWKLEEVMPRLCHQAVAYIKNTEPIFKRKEDSPFFLYLPLTAPHTPIAPTRDFQGTSEAGAYGDFVQEVDWLVGEIVKTLEEEGLAENTLIIFTSDNGSPGRDGTNMEGQTQSVCDYGHHPSYHFRGIKADIFEGGHRVPFIAKWPKQIAAHTQSDEIICLNDFMATCADLLGYSLPQDAAEDSYSILPLLQGKKINAPLREATVHHSIQGLFAIRKGQWKLIEGGSSGGWSAPNNEEQAAKKGLASIQLYNLEKDISEQHNVFDQHPEVVQELQALLQKYKDEGRSVPLRP